VAAAYLARAKKRVEQQSSKEQLASSKDETQTNQGAMS
jgi:hypothetical protein